MLKSEESFHIQLRVSKEWFMSQCHESTVHPSTAGKNTPWEPSCFCFLGDFWVWMKMLMDGVDMMLNRNLLYMEKILSVIVLLNRLKDTTHSSWTRNQPQNSLPARDDLIGPSTCQSRCRTQQCLQDQMVLIQRLKVSETIRSPQKWKIILQVSE